MTFTSMRRRAFTLVEVLVTLVVIGVSLAVVAPSLVLRRSEPGVAEVLTATRRAAIGRAQSVTLVIGADGRWSTSAARDPGEPLLSGVISPIAAGVVEVRVSPLGVCTVQRGRMSPRLSFDPLTCAVVDSARVPQ